ncbi:MAG: hypothetical protein ACLQM6_10025 [Acidobacteriaceae bacterium]
MNRSNEAQTTDGLIERAQGEMSTMDAERQRRTSGLTAAGMTWMGRSLLGAGLGLALVLGVAGCHKTPQATDSQSADDQNGADPADDNMAQAGAGQPAQVLGARAQEQNQQQGEDTSQQQAAAPIVRQAPDSGQQSYDNGAADNGQLNDQQANELYADDLTDAQASDPPPPLPEYDQPPAPDPNYLWTPGYWAWGPEGYYWVPGCWVEAPYEGALWTPGYWGFYGGFYRFHHGYWGLHIGFYGGVDYGYGYIGHNYYGGYWNGGHFFYNTTITRVNVNVIHNVYVHKVVINNVTVTGRISNRVSFNGGNGGVQARPLVAESRVLQERRIPPMASQVQVQHEAAQNRQQLYSQNKGRPAVAVAARPIAKDRVLPSALPRTAAPTVQPGNRGAVISGQRQAPRQAARPPAGQQARPAPANSQARPVQQNRSQPQGRQAQPQPQTRQAQPQTRQAQPQARPQEQAAPRPQPEARPAQAPRPQPQAAPRPQPQARPAQAARPQPAPAARPQSKEEEKPR